MKTRTEAIPPADSAVERDHPFRGLKDGWRPLARVGRDQGVQVQTCLEVVLDPERSAWVLQQATRTGLDFESYVKSLIDAARAAEGEQSADQV